MSAVALWYEGTIDVKIIFHNPKFSFEFLRPSCSEGKTLGSPHSSKASFVWSKYFHMNLLLTNRDSSRESAIYFWLPSFFETHNSLLQFAVIASIAIGCFFKRDLSNLLKPAQGGTSLDPAGRARGRQTGCGAACRGLGNFPCVHFQAWLGPSPLDQSYSESWFEKPSERCACRWGNCYF